MANSFSSHCSAAHGSVLRCSNFISSTVLGGRGTVLGARAAAGRCSGAEHGARGFQLSEIRCSGVEHRARPEHHPRAPFVWCSGHPRALPTECRKCRKCGALEQFFIPLRIVSHLDHLTVLYYSGLTSGQRARGERRFHCEARRNVSRDARHNLCPTPMISAALSGIAGGCNEVHTARLARCASS